MRHRTFRRANYSLCPRPSPPTRARAAGQPLPRPVSRENNGTQPNLPPQGTLVLDRYNVVWSQLTLERWPMAKGRRSARSVERSCERSSAARQNTCGQVRYYNTYVYANRVHGLPCTSKGRNERAKPHPFRTRVRNRDPNLPSTFRDGTHPRFLSRRRRIRGRSRVKSTTKYPLGNTRTLKIHRRGMKISREYFYLSTE